MSGTATVSVWRRPVLGNTLNLWKWELVTWFCGILSLALHLFVYRTTWTLLDTWVSGMMCGAKAGALRCVLWRATGGSGIAECGWAPYTRRILLNWIYMADISCNGCRTRKRHMQSPWPFLLPTDPHKYLSLLSPSYKYMHSVGCRRARFVNTVIMWSDLSPMSGSPPPQS